MSYSELKTPEANFRLIHRGEGDRSYRQDWPPKVDAVVPELVHDRPIKDLEERFAAFAAELETNSAFRHLKEQAKLKKAKIAFLDLAESPEFSHQRDLGLSIFEVLVGSWLVFKGLSLFSFEKKCSKKRRLSLAGILVVGLWFLLVLVDLLGILLTTTAGNLLRKGPLRAVNEAVARAGNVHPEKAVVFWRNLVVAEKTWYLVELLKKEKPNIVLDFHFGHAGLIKMLDWPQSWRLFLIDRFSFLMKDTLSDPVKRDYLQRVMVVAYREQNWQLERAPLVESLKNC